MICTKRVDTERRRIKEETHKLNMKERGGEEEERGNMEGWNREKKGERWRGK